MRPACAIDYRHGRYLRIVYTCICYYCFTLMNHSSGRQPNRGDKAYPSNVNNLANRQRKKHLHPASHAIPVRDPELDQLNLIIDAALMLDPSKRKSFIRRSCGPNEALKERIFKLIDRCTTPPPPEFLTPPESFRQVAHVVYRRYLDEGD